MHVAEWFVMIILMHCIYRKVLAEVEKIRQFESLWATETPDGEGCVQHALRKTSETVRDINTLLEK